MYILDINWEKEGESQNENERNNHMFRSFFNKGKQREKIVLNKTEQSHEIESFYISKSLQENIDYLIYLLDDTNDLKIRVLQISDANIKVAIIFFEGISDPITTEQSILNNIEKETNLPLNTNELFDYISHKLIAVNDVKKEGHFNEIVNALLSGMTIFLMEDVNDCLIINTIGGDFRQIEEPVTETLIRGPRDGFVENIQSNLALIRRSIRDPNLRFKTYTVGRRSRNNLVVVYVDDIVHPPLIEELDRRLKTIDIDIVPESGYIEQLIEDSFLSPFPQILHSERPDKVSAAIMQGKFAIILDGTPFVLIAPAVFANVLQSPEDYYERWTIGSLLRILRYFGAFISIFLPALYIALVSFQPGMIPSELVFSIAGTRQDVPFPPVVEAFLMVVTFELLQEAGARLPQTIGQTIGIVGGLVIGEASVQAGIVSPIMVIVIALTAVANFAIHAYSVAIGFRIIRFGFMIAAGMFGLYGLVLAYIMVNIHFVNLKSFGVPYSTPFSPFFKKDWNDVIIRFPLAKLTNRPGYLSPEDNTSQDNRGV